MFMIDLCLILCCVYVVLCWFFTSLVYVRLLASDLVPIDEALWVYLIHEDGLTIRIRPNLQRDFGGDIAAPKIDLVLISLGQAQAIPYVSHRNLFSKRVRAFSSTRSWRVARRLGQPLQDVASFLIILIFFRAVCINDLP